MPHGDRRSYHVQVYQAQGMVSVQANCTLADALVLLECTADATDETLEAIAELVVNREVRFDGADYMN